MRVLLTGGTGFIGTPVARALRAAGHDVTIVSRRPGYVPEKAIPFRAGLGGPVGNGKQWVSWIHLRDVVGLVVAAVASDAYTGPVNATAPTPVRNRDFSASLAKAVDRKAFLPVPGFALRLAV